MSGMLLDGLEIADAPEPEDVPEKFDFTSPEDVLIEIIDLEDDSVKDGWRRFSIESCTIIRQANPEVTGAASYEESYGASLEWTIKEMVDCPNGPGWFVVEGITGHYHKGDGWTTDDDMDFYHTGIRPATDDEIKLA